MDPAIYEFIRGPLVWIGFIGFIGGTVYKITAMYGLAKKEKVVLPVMSMSHSIRSLSHWLTPFGARNMIQHPLMTIISFAFHFCLIVTPLFAMGHAVLWQASWGFSWFTFPPILIDLMTLVVIVVGAVFLIRRLVRPEVRYVTSFGDITILFLVISPFVTGLISHYQLLPAKPAILLHIICGVLWLLAVPFTRLSHMFWFVFSRTYMGSEFGAVRNARDW